MDINKIHMHNDTLHDVSQRALVLTAICNTMCTLQGSLLPHAVQSAAWGVHVLPSVTRPWN